MSVDLTNVGIQMKSDASEAGSTLSKPVDHQKTFEVIKKQQAILKAAFLKGAPTIPAGSPG